MLPTRWHIQDLAGALHRVHPRRGRAGLVEGLPGGVDAARSVAQPRPVLGRRLPGNNEEAIISYQARYEGVVLG